MRVSEQRTMALRMSIQGTWDFWIDRGGTFTDVVARAPDGELHTRKLLSENPDLYSDAALAGVRQFLGIDLDAPIPRERIASVKMGTTVATNALLQRRGADTLFLTTQGFADVLQIGTQARPDIFAHQIIKPGMLYARVAEARERIRADGTVEMPLEEEHLRNILQEAFDAGISSVAICFLHGYAFPHHEKLAADIARSCGFTQISVSHEVSPLIKLVNRGDTTVADAYLSPILRRYVDKVSDDLGDARLFFMTSAGGLTASEQFRGKDAILSGPAGGIVGMAETARFSGIDKVIGFDMGGTSTDVSHYAGGPYERSYETEVAGTRLSVPMMQIHTVAAGGGSILQFDGERFRVGPQSAGADPGPLAYRRGGPLTVTDANIMVGKVLPEFFPHIFGPQGDQPLDKDGVADAFKSLAEEIGDGRSAQHVADGFLHIGVQNMASAIKTITIERGIDVSDYTLCAFGGAGGQHACLVADCLGIKKLFIHRLSGLLSAYGMGLADIRTLNREAIEHPLNHEVIGQLLTTQKALTAQNETALRAQGVLPDACSHHTEIIMRYAGTDTALSVEGHLLEASALRSGFEALHQQRFGFCSPDKEIIVDALVVESAGGGSEIEETCQEGTPPYAPQLYRKTVFFSSGVSHDANVFMRDDLLPGHEIPGPALIIEEHQTIVVEPGWQATISEHDHLFLERSETLETQPLLDPSCADPVMLEIFNNLFMSIAEQMGEALRSTARSVNIKERLDYSCGVFDAEGGLVANAPHVPVHLGSMDRSVETVIDSFKGDMHPGDVFMLNAPYNGGTHLPDITVVTPVFDRDQHDVRFFVASRGHHADVGGIAPGSMSPTATRIEEEGVYIEPCRLVSNGSFLEEKTHRLFSDAPYPARNVPQNIADLKAQVAANQRGVEELLSICEQFGTNGVQAYMRHVQDNGEESVRRAISLLSDCSYSLMMDQGTQICVRITTDSVSRSAVIDFTGTSDAQPNNFNAPEPVARAATLYVFRTLIGDSIPINAGCLRPLEIVILEGCMLSPRYPSAVVAGNVETSQVIADCLFGALGVLGSSQGTMNNLTFGNDRYQYYETICSGSPAGPGFNGTAGVQTHMTNSRLTDPEILERRFPVCLETFRIVPGSGGAGRWCAGDGTERVIRFLEDMDCAILSGFRQQRPAGTDGGAPGRRGQNLVRRKDGTVEKLEGCAQTQMKSGDAIVIRTPTGGGYGSAD